MKYQLCLVVLLLALLACVRTADAVNGVFEAMGALFIVLNIQRIRADKRVAGVSWLATAFFALWGYWNLYYYPTLGQWFSFAGGLAIVVTNTIYVGQLFYYTYWPDK